MTYKQAMMEAMRLEGASESEISDALQVGSFLVPSFDADLPMKLAPGCTEADVIEFERQKLREMLGMTASELQLREKDVKAKLAKDRSSN